MDADERLKAVHDRVRGSLMIRTNLTTKEGRQIAIAWNHVQPDGKSVPCLVTGDSLDLAFRKVIDVEEDFEDEERPKQDA